MDLALLGVVGAAVVLSVMVQDLPEVDALLEVKFEEPLRIYTAEGSLMAEFGVQRRRAVDFDDIPPDLVNAFITAEDNRFFDHIGFDLIGLARAAYAVVQSGSASQGGSTITMQVARNFFLTPEKTVKRKLSEILLALRVESALTKQEIMELYLNKIFFGHRAYGISAAAELYYGKTLDQLTLAEMAMLAGLPKAPSANNPLIDPERARERRDYILSRMLELGYIDEERYAAAVASPLTAVAYTAPIEFRAGYVAEMARQEIVERFGEEGAYSLGLRVTTTIEEKLQTESDRSIRRALMAYNKRHGYHGPEATIDNVAELSAQQLDELLAERPKVPELAAGIVTSATASSAEVYLGAGVTETLKLSQVNWARRYKTENWRGPKPRRVTDAVAVGDVIRLRRDDKGNAILAQVPTVGGALVALSTSDGAIRSLSGGYEFEWSKFNRAADAKRQPGSTFKPFVYAAALGKGYTPASLLKDEKQQFGSWKPENSDGKYMGPIRMRVALTKSRNLAMVNLIDRMGVDYARDFIQRFGYSMDDMPEQLRPGVGRRNVHAAATRSGLRDTRQRRLSRRALSDQAHRRCPGQCPVRGKCATGLPRLLGEAEQGRGRGDGRWRVECAAGGAGAGPAHRLQHGLDDGGRDQARHRDSRASGETLRHRRQDRHHQRFAGFLVRRFHARPGHCRLDGDGRQPSAGSWRVGRYRRAWHVGRLHGRCPRWRAHRRDSASGGHGRGARQRVHRAGGKTWRYRRVHSRRVSADDLGAGPGAVRGSAQRVVEVQVPTEAGSAPRDG